MQVLYNITAFRKTGQVVLHGGGFQKLTLAKRAFEDYFRLLDNANTKDVEV